MKLTFFFENLNPCLSKHFGKNKFIWTSAYLKDTFSSLHHLNVKMQGKNVTVIDVRDKIQGFQEKLDPWSRRVQKGIYKNFPTIDGSNISKSYSVIYHHGVEKCQHPVTSKSNFDSFFDGTTFQNTCSLDNPFLRSQTRKYCQTRNFGIATMFCTKIN